MDDPSRNKVYEFEDYRLDAGHLMLYRRGEEVLLAPKAVQTLLALIERCGEIVSKDELLEIVWPDTCVEESNLYLYLSLLRRELGAQKNGRPYLDTLHRRGYRFNGDVRPSGRNWAKGVREESAEAKCLYLLGRHHAYRLTPADHTRAIDYLEKAQELDPDYPMPHVGIALANLVNVLANDSAPCDRMPRALASARKAVDLDPELSEARIALGAVALFYLWDWNLAESELILGYDLDPNSGEANSFLAHFCSNVGLHGLAITFSERAAILDPLNLRRGAQYGQFLYYARKYEESIEQLKTVIELDPNFWLPHMFIARPYLEKGSYRDAALELGLAKQLGSVSLELTTLDAYACARAGEIKAAESALSDMQKLARNRYVPPYFLAVIHNSLGDTERALDCLEVSYAVRDARLTWIKVDPKWDNLRSEARFLELLRKMHLNHEWTLDFREVRGNNVTH